MSSAMENGAPSEPEDPSTFLAEILGAPVTVKLNSGVVYRGSLSVTNTFD
jgi:U6 snRNA-associated Sm-like protein LSm6